MPSCNRVISDEVAKPKSKDDGTESKSSGSEGPAEFIGDTTKGNNCIYRFIKYDSETPVFFVIRLILRFSGIYEYTKSGLLVQLCTLVNL